MVEAIITFLVGVICIILGALNMKGNISSLHSYHRHRVSEEDRIPFGKQVGLGTVVVGIGIIIFAISFAITLYSSNNVFIFVGIPIMFLCIIVGLIISFKAMLKYNKGIF